MSLLLQIVGGLTGIGIGWAIIRSAWWQRLVTSPRPTPTDWWRHRNQVLNRRCHHHGAVDVGLVLTGEVVARLCPDCGAQLPPNDVRQRSRLGAESLNAGTYKRETADQIRAAGHEPIDITQFGDREPRYARGGLVRPVRSTDHRSCCGHRISHAMTCAELAALKVGKLRWNEFEQRYEVIPHDATA